MKSTRFGVFNEVFKTINIGDILPGCVKTIRKDIKLIFPCNL